jgi:restriction endonuclease
MKLNEFRSRSPIDILTNTNPILIIDEPQSVEGVGGQAEKTKTAIIMEVVDEIQYKENYLWLTEQERMSLLTD